MLYIINANLRYCYNPKDQGRSISNMWELKDDRILSLLYQSGEKLPPLPFWPFITPPLSLPYRTLSIIANYWKEIGRKEGTKEGRKEEEKNKKREREGEEGRKG